MTYDATNIAKGHLSHSDDLKLIQDVLKNEKFLFILLERKFFIWISFYLKKQSPLIQIITKIPT